MLDAASNVDLGPDLPKITAPWAVRDLLVRTETNFPQCEIAVPGLFHRVVWVRRDCRWWVLVLVVCPALWVVFRCIRLWVR